MRVLSDGRRYNPLGEFLVGLAFLVGFSVLAFVGAFVTVRALVEWLT